MDLFNSKPQVVILPPPQDTLGGSLLRGMGISVGIWLCLSHLTPILHLPPRLAGTSLIFLLFLLSALTILFGAKAGRIIQTATLGVLKMAGLGFYAILRIAFNGITKLMSGKPTS